MIRLVFPDATHEAGVMAYRADCFAADEAHIHGASGLDSAADYAAWLRLQSDCLHADTVPNGWVTGHTFLAIREADGKVVGLINIRHSLTDYLLREGGHIGYSIRPGERRKGYATEMLAQALAFCRDTLGLKRVLVTCNKDNLASARTIQRNGGMLEDEPVSEAGNIIQRYWIALG